VQIFGENEAENTRKIDCIMHENAGISAC